MPAPPPGGEEDLVNTRRVDRSLRSKKTHLNLPPDDPRLAVAMTMESYPEDSRTPSILERPSFSRCDDHGGQPKEAVAALSEWIETNRLFATKGHEQRFPMETFLLPATWQALASRLVTGRSDSNTQQPFCAIAHPAGPNLRRAEYSL